MAVSDTDQQERASLPWHALDPADVRQRLETSDDGLTSEEARGRLEHYGPNELEQDEPPSNLEIVLRQFKSPLIYILLLAAIVTIAIAEYIDTMVILAVLALNTVIGFIQERKADRSVRALMQLAAPKARAVRDGQPQTVESRDLVPGDIVLLESGARVPADLRIVAARALQIDESLLTGESLPTTKRPDPVADDALAPDRTSMAHMGSIVASGRGRGAVVATGAATELGMISEQIRAQRHPPTPLQQRMTRLGHIIAIAVLASSAAAFTLGVALGEPVADMFLAAVALAVAVVPEGLPVAFTVALALGVRRMARRNAIVRSLPAVETLGSTDAIGSDKTGTLTQNRMTVQRIWAGQAVHPVGAGAPPPEDGAADGWSPLREALVTGVLTNEASVSWDDGEARIAGDPTEAALLVAADQAGLDHRDLRARHELIADLPFEPDRRYSASVRAHGDLRRLHVKGAPERVLEMCTQLLTDDGPVPLDREAVPRVNTELAEQGLRVLAVGARGLPTSEQDADEVPEPQDLVLLGLQAMLDPPRDGVRDAIDGCRRAGVRVMMITGDNPATARAIARDLGLAGDDAEVLTGQDLEVMSDEELSQRAGAVPVFARVSPQHKHRIVEALHARGHVVAVTGDGVNDGPALKAADIGVAMGRDGTDVAREASDMVLADDNFVSIYHAVEEGRVVFDNVRKVTFFLLSTGVAAIATLLYTLVAGLPLPFLPAQLLWLNVVTNGLQDVALAFEPAERGVLNRPPRPRRAPVITARLWERTALTGAAMAVGALLLFQRSLDLGHTIGQARTVAITTLVLFMAFHVYSARSLRHSLFGMNPLGNPFLLAATLGALALHAAAVHWTPTQFVLRFEPVDAATWLRMAVVAASIVAVNELHKLLRGEPDPPA